MNRFKKKRLLRKYDLPKVMKNVWLAAGIHMSDKKYPPVWDENGDYIDNNIGDILPMEELPDGQFAYYKIISSSHRRGDWLYDTDAYQYTMEFSHVGEFKIRWTKE